MIGSYESSGAHISFYNNQLEWICTHALSSSSLSCRHPKRPYSDWEQLRGNLFNRLSTDLWRGCGEPKAIPGGEGDVLLVDSSSRPAGNISVEGGQKWQREIALPLALHWKCVSSLSRHRREERPQTNNWTALRFTRVTHKTVLWTWNGINVLILFKLSAVFCAYYIAAK